MQVLKNIRKYELWIITLATVLYVIRSLSEHAANYNRSYVQIWGEDEVPLPNITQDIETYSHVTNTVFPVIAGAVLFLCGWYLFHFLFVPSLKEKHREQQSLLFLAGAVFFVIASIFVYDFFKLYLRYRYDVTGNIIGLKVYSLFRKLHLLTNTLAVLLLLVIYEALAQLYYFFIFKVREEGNSYRLLEYVFNGIIVLLILSVALFGRVPESFWSGIMAELLYWPVIIAGIVGAQQVYYRKVFPLIAQQDKSRLILPFFIATGIALFSSVIFEFLQIITWLVRGNRFYFGWKNVRDILIQFLAFTLIAAFLALIRRALSREKVFLATAVSRKTAELDQLRAQINPHFLFNTLNTLYSVSLKESAEQTAGGIQKLGDMMRFMLNENHRERIPLSKEIEYLDNYLDIQRMRIDEERNVEIRVNIQHPEGHFMIAPMLLNPFVENAFKHGISFRRSSWIYITLTHDETRLFFKVHNSLHPRQDVIYEAHESNGIGLENVKKRLQLIYPQRHTLDIQESEQDYFISLTLLLS